MDYYKFEDERHILYEETLTLNEGIITVDREDIDERKLKNILYDIEKAHRTLFS